MVDIREMDLRKEFPPVSASVILSVLTLQFTPINYRQNIIQKAYDALLPGGCLIVVEKVLGSGSKLDSMMVDLYTTMKRTNGYSTDDIDRKAMSLEGVLVPVTAAWNEQLLQLAGFKHIDCFWRWMNFAGWVAIR